MELIELKRDLSAEQWRDLAASCDTTPGHLNNICYGSANANPALARLLEENSGGRVRRWTLRPADWHLIWPELIDLEGAPQAIGA